MTSPACPFCGAPLPPGRVAGGRCATCGKKVPSPVTAEPAAAGPALEVEEVEVAERPVRRLAHEEVARPEHFIVPIGVSGWSLASCYLGLIGFCLPVVGLVFAIPALIFGIVALKRRRAATTYGAVTSDIRAIIGLVLSSLAILIAIGVLVLWAVTAGPPTSAR